ncbi:hypothetical protein TWF506_007809 [Arthrobotrys conoides]|uniref:Uncharacterized protein n=1 Tax=Arthrobotrys conoides TaxID=74498 RepID=A0AAN8RYA1_9PEZI
MAPNPAPRRIHASSLTFTYLILITLQLSPPTYGYWDNFAYGNGNWFNRYRENTGNLIRDGSTGVYDCHTTNTRNMNDPALDGAIVWNRPNEPAILGLAFYDDGACGKSMYAPSRGIPLAAMILDKRRLRGLHIANFKKLDNMEPPAVIRNKRTMTAQAFRVSDEVKTGRFLRGIPPEELPNSIVWWDTAGKRHVLRNGVSWANAVLYEPLNQKKNIYRFIREIVERAINAKPDTAPGNSDYLMMTLNDEAGINIAEGQSRMQLMLPAPDPNLDLTLPNDTNDDYGLPINGIEDRGSTLGPALTSKPVGGSPMLAVVPPVALENLPQVQSVGIQVVPGSQFPQGAPVSQPQQVAPVSQPQQAAPVARVQSIAPDDLSEQNNPNTGSRDSLFEQSRADTSEELRQALQEVERQVEAHDPTTLVARLDIPVDKLTAAFNAAPDKKAWLDGIEERERVNMRVLLLLKDWYAEYEEKRQGLPPGSLSRPNAWTSLNIDTLEIYPELRKIFDRAPDKMLWYALMESRQKWNMRALRVARDLYQNWLETEEGSIRAHQGSHDSVESGGDALVIEDSEAGNVNAPEPQNDVISIPDPNDETIILQQGPQNAMHEDDIILIEADEANNPNEFVNFPYTDSFFATANSPTFVVSDDVNLEIPDSSNQERERESSPQAIELETEVQQQPSEAPAVSTEQQNQLQQSSLPSARGVLRLQTEGLDPNDPFMIDDFYKYFNPESDALKDIFRFNPRLIQEIRKNPSKVLGIPDLGIRHYTPPVPGFGVDLEDSALFDTPSGTLSESDSGGDAVEENLGLEEIMDKIAEEAAAEVEAGRLAGSEIEPEEATAEDQTQFPEPLIAGRPASEVMEEIAEQLQEQSPEEQPRRSTRYNGLRPPPKASRGFEPSFTPRQRTNDAGRQRRRTANMADVFEDIPVVEPKTNHPEEPPPRIIEYWQRSLENRRDKNPLIKNRGSNRDVNLGKT